MSSPSLPIVKALFARSRNQCAFKDCTVPLVEATGTITGEISHIKAASRGGPRYDAKQPEEERYASSNLILLCSRHHKIIDTEPKTYPASVITDMKRLHEQDGFTEISPEISKNAKALLVNYTAYTISNNSGQIAIASPGAIQSNTVNNFNNTRTKISVTPPSGSIGASQPMVSYCTYLIGRYQEYQKQDFTGKTDFKYMAIYIALKRRFKGEWKLLEESWFPDVVAFLQARIDGTIIGKINKSKKYKNYHDFTSHQKGNLS